MDAHHLCFSKLGSIRLDPLWVRRGGIVLTSGPDSQHSHEIVDPAEAALDGSRAVIEKKTLVDMGLAFAVAMKHYLRGEEGM